MGGKAFQAEGLYTPRMPSDVYNRVLQQALQKLCTIFARAETTLEAPEKLDHGDIDILVVSAVDIPSNEQIAALIGAKHFKNTLNNPTTHFAIPWPTNIEVSADTSDQNEMVIGPTAQEKTSVEYIDEALKSTDLNRTINSNTQPELRPWFIQVDVHICKDTTDLNQILFAHAHGDLHRMLGAIVRRFGITLSETGLYIRITELEAWNKNEARVRLTHTPNDTLEYLGLDVGRFWKPFTTLDDCMDYAASCRFHDPGRGRKDEVQDKEDFKRHDRVRVLKRPMFEYWMETFLPSHCDDPPGSAADMTREEVIEDAKQRIGSEFAEKFDRQQNEGVRAMGLQYLWANIRKEIEAEGSDLTYAMKGLKSEITMIPDEKSGRSKVHDDYRAGRFDEVRVWCLENWREVGKRQEELDRLQSAVKYRGKFAKENQFKDIKSSKGVSEKQQ